MTLTEIHAAILARINELWGAKADTPEAFELDVLADACVAIEDKLCPMGGNEGDASVPSGENHHSSVRG